ncbi:uncharacterized protein RJT20DRAFT_132929 [Scheffersomyces xylosifermentans]|uniref:uncharacterized protein n=1 Tax=Scheffersomyces xylosifermentans TaxID=1304137 RepID=UPI00315D0361
MNQSTTTVNAVSLPPGCLLKGYLIESDRKISVVEKKAKREKEKIRGSIYVYSESVEKAIRDSWNEESIQIDALLEDIEEALELASIDKTNGFTIRESDNTVQYEVHLSDSQ